MAPKKKGQPKSAVAAAADADFEAMLAGEAAKNEAAAPTPVAPPAPPAATAAADDGSDSDEEGEAKGDKKDKDKKKKKKKKDKKEDKPAVAAAPLTAAGRAILERKKAQEEQDAAFNSKLAEETRKIREEEEAVAAEEKRVEEEREKKRKAKADKVDAQKAAGTFMTKAEKEKERKRVARLEALGLDPNAPASSDAAAAPKVVYAKKKPTKATTPTADAAKPIEKEKEVAPAAEDEDVADDWESGDFLVSAVAAKISELATGAIGNKAEDEVEDILQKEKEAEQENLKRLGIERLKREEEARIVREAEEAVRAEMDRLEREAAQRKEQSRKRRNARDAEARAAASPAYLRAPISCIMGHVDTGKTKLLDKIRHTNVQEGEAGGITQQIGATQFSREVLEVQTAGIRAIDPFDIRIPGLLMIDTPGHEAFQNLRSRGSSLANLAILVIDLMHGLEPQTIESINLLKRKRTPFIVALNKVDRCYNWQPTPDSPFRVSLAKQTVDCQAEFADRAERIKGQLMEQGLNSCLYWNNKDLGKTISLVPTSAMTGEGIPDLLKMIITLTQERLEKDIQFVNVLQCTVLEVKVIEGLGHTMDVVLVNGTLREGDTIIVSTLDGPVTTTIRALLTPPPNRESRVKTEFVHHRQLTGAIGLKIAATDIAKAVAGTPILVVQEGDDIEDVKDDVQSDLSSVMKSLATDAQGVMVHCSTLGALEALLQFLREECKPPIPVGHINIGPIHKKDIMRANIMNEKGKPEFATILAFDVKIDTEAQEMADENKVRIFSADIIYHLFDQFSAYMAGVNETRRAAAQAVAVYPCIVKVRYIHHIILYYYVLYILHCLSCI
jgi:translation initiation factor 5B